MNSLHVLIYVEAVEAQYQLVSNKDPVSRMYQTLVRNPLRPSKVFFGDLSSNLSAISWLIRMHWSSVESRARNPAWLQFNGFCDSNRWYDSLSCTDLSMSLTVQDVRLIGPYEPG